MSGVRNAAVFAAVSMFASVCAAAASAQPVLTEYDSQWNLKMIGVEAAYKRGYTGKGVVIGVVDSGINPTHRDLIGQLTPYSLDIYTSGLAVIDPQGHGTHVAGIIAGARNGFGIQGVAYDSRLSVLRLLDANNVASAGDDAIAKLLNYGLDNGVRIFNNSWGGLYIDPDGTPQQVAAFYGHEAMSAYQRAVDLDSILVWATGNEKLQQPGLQAGLPYYFPAWRGHWIAVTAVGTDGKLASYANRCGLAAQWCLAAPGGDTPLPGETLDDSLIWSAANDSNTNPAGQGGTSQAAPHVTGAVAIARQMFPNAPAAAITRLVLTSATDLGQPGVDDIYGWGLLNIGNMAITLDAEAGSLFANGAWAADAGQRALYESIDGRLSDGATPGAWGAILAGRARHDVTTASLASEAETYGVAVGYDLEARPGVLLGLAIAETRTMTSEAAGANTGEIRSIGGFVYGRFREGRWFVEGSAGAEARSYDYERGDILGTAGTVLAGAGVIGESSTDGVAMFARARIGANFAAGPVEIRPFVQARASQQRIDAFDERGADVYSQSVLESEHTVYEAGPGVEIAVAPYRLGRGEIGGALALRYDTRWGDDDFATRSTMLGSPIPAAVGELEESLTASARVNARLGGRWEGDARGWWTQGGNHEAGGLSLGLRMTF